mgnify:CR=1 FL=1
MTEPMANYATRMLGFHCTQYTDPNVITKDVICGSVRVRPGDWVCTIDGSTMIVPNDRFRHWFVPLEHYAEAEASITAS